MSALSTLIKVVVLFGAFAGVFGTLLFLEHLFPSPAWDTPEGLIAAAFAGCLVGAPVGTWLARR